MVRPEEYSRSAKAEQEIIGQHQDDMTDQSMLTKVISQVTIEPVQDDAMDQSMAPP
jgi:hypothetical protein